MKEKLHNQNAKFNKILHFYMSYACKFGYHKQVREKLDEAYHPFLPD